MTGGRTKCTALVNQVLFPYSMELVQEDLATDASNKEFSCSAKKREDLKECFDFFESEYREVIRHVPTRWLSLCKALDRMLSPWGPLKRYFIERGSDNCPTALWAILSDQENEISGEANPTYNELYLYFTHNFMASFQEIILLVEKHTTASFNLHNIMVKFHDTISKKINDKYFGIKVHVALKKGHLLDHEVEKFTKNATNAYHRALAYIEKWYPFENQYYKTFSCLNLECGRLPTLDQLLELWSISPWKQQTPPEQIYDELAALQSVFLHSNSKVTQLKCGANFSKKRRSTESAENCAVCVQCSCIQRFCGTYVQRL
ncbi:uncharacterized protein TNCV_509651 [Trichonephila clavipes]|nr:uncharacterized protein TNCV_509651 [Trichonephila clavipes]